MRRFNERTHVKAFDEVTKLLAEAIDAERFPLWQLQELLRTYAEMARSLGPTEEDEALMRESVQECVWLLAKLDQLKAERDAAANEARDTAARLWGWQPSNGPWPNRLLSATVPSGRCEFTHP
jgi:hypothetical protein